MVGLRLQRERGWTGGAWKQEKVEDSCSRVNEKLLIKVTKTISIAWWASSNENRGVEEASLLVWKQCQWEWWRGRETSGAMKDDSCRGERKMWELDQACGGGKDWELCERISMIVGYNTRRAWEGNKTMFWIRFPLFLFSLNIEWVFFCTTRIRKDKFEGDFNKLVRLHKI